MLLHHLVILKVQLSCGSGEMLNGVGESICLCDQILTVVTNYC